MCGRFLKRARYALKLVLYFRFLKPLRRIGPNLAFPCGALSAHERKIASERDASKERE